MSLEQGLRMLGDLCMQGTGDVAVAGEVRTFEVDDVGRRPS